MHDKDVIYLQNTFCMREPFQESLIVEIYVTGNKVQILV